MEAYIVSFSEKGVYYYERREKQGSDTKFQVLITNEESNKVLLHENAKGSYIHLTMEAC